MDNTPTIDGKVLVIKPQFDAFPIGFAYVLSCLERNGIPFDFVDTTLQPDYKKYLTTNKYFAVTTGGIMLFHEFFHEVCQTVHNLQPNIPVILGGNITKDLRDDFLFDKIGMDFGIVGEAETSLPHILNSIYYKSENFDDIPGLIYKDSNTGQIKKNPSIRLDLQNENYLPGWKFINLNYYIKSNSNSFMRDWRNLIPVLSGRGCIGRCGFCSPTIGAFRKRPIGQVIDEIKFLKLTYDFNLITFYNEMFYQEKEDILTFCREYKNEKIDKAWTVSLRADAGIDLDTLKHMKNAGCIGISVGIESGSDRILKTMRKGTTRDQIINFFRLAKEAEILCSGSFIIAYEDENEKDLAETFDMVINEDMISDYLLLRAYPGTTVYRHAVKKGLITDEWAYFLQLRSNYGPFNYGPANKNYLNLTNIPSSNFWDIVVEQCRRFHTHHFQNHQIEELKCNEMINDGKKKYELSGVCPRCKNHIKITVETIQFPPECIPDGKNCPICSSTIVYNTYQCSETNRIHYHHLRNHLRQAKHIAIFGTRENAIKLWRTNFFDMDYKKIIGFFSFHYHNWSSINMKLLNFEEVLEAKPDLIIITDSESSFFIKSRFIGE
jgi:radical SAM superfamily enzyme YgiQ (UPF0313 family)